MMRCLPMCGRREKRKETVKKQEVRKVEEKRATN